jgi:hypothetical protein
MPHRCYKNLALGALLALAFVGQGAESFVPSRFAPGKSLSRFLVARLAHFGWSKRCRQGHLDNMEFPTLIMLQLYITWCTLKIPKTDEGCLRRSETLCSKMTTAAATYVCPHGCGIGCGCHSSIISQSEAASEEAPEVMV